MKKALMILGLVSLLSVVVFAREYSEVTCTNEKCGFKDDFGEGPTMARDWVTGYCIKCEKFVWRNWDKNGGDPKPPQIFKVWDATSGKTRELFPCPHCNQLVLAIKDKSEIKFCPKCNSDKIKISAPHTFKD